MTKKIILLSVISLLSVAIATPTFACVQQGESCFANCAKAYRDNYFLRALCSLGSERSPSQHARQH